MEGRAKLSTERRPRGRDGAHAADAQARVHPLQGDDSVVDGARGRVAVAQLQLPEQEAPGKVARLVRCLKDGPEPRRPRVQKFFSSLEKQETAEGPNEREPVPSPRAHPRSGRQAGRRSGIQRERHTCSGDRRRRRRQAAGGVPRVFPSSRPLGRWVGGPGRGTGAKRGGTGAGGADVALEPLRRFNLDPPAGDADALGFPTVKGRRDPPPSAPAPRRGPSPRHESPPDLPSLPLSLPSRRGGDRGARPSLRRSGGRLPTPRLPGDWREARTHS